MTSGEELLTVAEAMRLLVLDEAQLKRVVSEGRLRARRGENHSLWFAREDVEHYRHVNGGRVVEDTRETPQDGEAEEPAGELEAAAEAAAAAPPPVVVRRRERVAPAVPRAVRKPPRPAAAEAGLGAEQRVLFRAPVRMRAGESCGVSAQLSRETFEELARRLASSVSFEDEHLDPVEFIEVHLDGQGFDVESVGKEGRFVAERGLMTWSWQVTPRGPGIKRLMLVATLHLRARGQGEEPHQVLLGTRRVEVSPTTPSARNLLILLALLAAFILLLAILS